MKMFVGSLLIVILVGNCQAASRVRKNTAKLARLWAIADFYSKRGTTLKVPSFDVVKKKDVVRLAALSQALKLGSIDRKHALQRMRDEDTVPAVQPELDRKEYNSFKSTIDMVFLDDADFDSSNNINWLEALCAGTAQIGKSDILKDLHEDQNGAPSYEDGIEAFVKGRLGASEFSLIENSFNGEKSSRGVLDGPAFDKFIARLYGSGSKKDYDMLRYLLGLIEVNRLPSPIGKNVKDGKVVTLASIYKYFVDDPITTALSNNAQLYVRLLLNLWDYNSNEELDETEYYLFQHSYGWVQYYDADFDDNGQLDLPEALVAVGAELGYTNFIRGLHDNSDGATTMINVKSYFGIHASGYPLATAQTIFNRHKVGTSIPVDVVGSFLDDILAQKK